VPVYVFCCPVCNGENELLLKLGDTAARPCTTEGCGGTARHKFARVAVKYEAFGFTKTDSLVANPNGKNFKELSNKAEQISDS
jgi:predicted nucleic acid-binding Zn ribbon protein